HSTSPVGPNYHRSLTRMVLLVIEGSLIELLVSAHDRFETVARTRLRVSLLAEFCPQSCVSGKPAKEPGHCFGIFRGRQQSASAIRDDFRDFVDARRDNGDSGGFGL